MLNPDLFPAFLNTGTTNETFRQSGKLDSLEQIKIQSGFWQVSDDIITLKFSSFFLFYIIIIIIIIELTHSKTIPKNTVEIEPQPAAFDFKDLS